MRQICIYVHTSIYVYIIHCTHFKFPFNNWRKVTPRSLRVPIISSVVDTFFPQGLDDPSFDVMSCLSYLSLFVLAALVEDRHKHSHAQNIEPQSEEVHTDTRNIEVGLNEQSSQNVTFVDTHPGYCIEEMGESDYTRDHAIQSDASLDEFFSRPILIHTSTWTSAAAPGGLLHAEFNPWALYFENKRVINRIANYKLLRSKLHLKFVISGNSFFYGRAVASYNPLTARDALTVDRNLVDADFVGATQRPHVFLDPTNSQGGEMVLPFFWYKDLLDITSDEWDQMGEIVMDSLVPLKHALGKFGEDITINVFAWAEDVKFAVPTHFEPPSIIPQSDEYGKKPISSAASTVANVARSLASIPILRPFARSTEIGADAVGALATLFGYSKPALLEVAEYRPVTKSNFAVTNAPDEVTKLTVDAKQELSIDPRTVGLGGVDELGINYIASRESYYTQFSWATGTAGETLLYNQVVDPGVFRTNSSEYHLPACAYAALPFKYWRGSMRYRFQVVCSKFHKGRLKVVYDPAKTATTAEYNTAYTTVIDIADTTDFTVDVGWGQPTKYRPSIEIASVVEGIISNTSALTYNSNTATYGNGTIAVYVVNELTAPETVVDNSIKINVFISAGPDFEVAAPDEERLIRLRLTNSSQLTQPTAQDVVPQSDEISRMNEEVRKCLRRSRYPHSPPNVRACYYRVLRESIKPHSDENKGEETERMDSKPGGTTVLSQRAAHTSLTDDTNKVYFGENIRSFRQLAKRYNMYMQFGDWWTGMLTGDEIRLRMIHDSMPWEPGYSATSGDFTYTTTTPAGNYHIANMTLLRYLTCAYGGWRGSVRWAYDFSRVLNSALNTVNVRAGHTFDDDDKVYDLTTVGNLNGLAGTAGELEQDRRISGHNGFATQCSGVNPIIDFEVPYYQPYRFTPGKMRVDFANSPTFATPKYIVQAEYTTNVSEGRIKSYCAAGEDWTCFMYLGPPIFYYEGTIPTT